MLRRMRISAWAGGSVDFSYYIMDEEVYADMKMTFSRKKDREQKFMDSVREWAAQVEEKFWLPEEQKVEQNYLLNERGRNRVIDCGLS